MTDSGEGDTPSRRNSSGKRFVRRARRWAELQQKRQGRRNCDVLEAPSMQSEPQLLQVHHHPTCYSHHAPHRSETKQHNYRPPEPPHVYDFVEMAALGSGVMVVDEDQNYELLTHEESRQKQHLAHTRSFPITILQSRRHQIQVPAGYPASYWYNRRSPCQRTSSDSYYHQYNNQKNPSSYHHSWYHPQQPSPASLTGCADNALTLITNDLSMTSISEASTTSPSSISNNSEEEVCPHYSKFSSSLPKSSSFPISLITKPFFIPSDFSGKNRFSEIQHFEFKVFW